MYLTFFTVAVLVLLFLFWKTVVIVPMREAYVVERLGKFRTILRPCSYILVPFFDKVAYRHDTREEVLDIPGQSCISQDNIQINIDGLVYLKVMDPQKASYGIEDYKSAAVNSLKPRCVQRLES